MVLVQWQCQITMITATASTVLQAESRVRSNGPASRVNHSYLSTRRPCLLISCAIEGKVIRDFLTIAAWDGGDFDEQAKYYETRLNMFTQTIDGAILFNEK